MLKLPIITKSVFWALILVDEYYNLMVLVG